MRRGGDRDPPNGSPSDVSQFSDGRETKLKVSLGKDTISEYQDGKQRET